MPWRTIPRLSTFIRKLLITFLLKCSIFLVLLSSPPDQCTPLHSAFRICFAILLCLTSRRHTTPTTASFQLFFLSLDHIKPHDLLWHSSPRFSFCFSSFLLITAFWNSICVMSFLHSVLKEIVLRLIPLDHNVNLQESHFLTLLNLQCKPSSNLVLIKTKPFGSGVSLT